MYSLIILFISNNLARSTQDSSEYGCVSQIRIISSSIAFISSQFTTAPVLSLKISGLPQVLNVNIGVPKAIASIFTVG